MRPNWWPKNPYKRGITATEQSREDAWQSCDEAIYNALLDRFENCWNDQDRLILLKNMLEERVRGDDSGE